MSADMNTAVVLVLSERRFFVGFGKKRQILTAWSLAGARLFGPWQIGDLARVERRLAAKGKAVSRRTVRLDEAVAHG